MILSCCGCGSIRTFICSSLGIRWNTCRICSCDSCIRCCCCCTWELKRTPGGYPPRCIPGCCIWYIWPCWFIIGCWLCWLIIGCWPCWFIIGC
ncbi:hypothetical protein L596_023152 [Steinernema carpocapsae]|uniref:Uncharacterized protein n=1 Tax=Steinernema carpocapsae TaxID=34508 RepID=A0A4U5MCT2_STECR|nr:hypothetical protein L596_023152 [Steinernema carpocapsae]